MLKYNIFAGFVSSFHKLIETNSQIFTFMIHDRNTIRWLILRPLENFSGKISLSEQDRKPEHLRKLIDFDIGWILAAFKPYLMSFIIPNMAHYSISPPLTPISIQYHLMFISISLSNFSQIFWASQYHFHRL